MSTKLIKIDVQERLPELHKMYLVETNGREQFIHFNEIVRDIDRYDSFYWYEKVPDNYAPATALLPKTVFVEVELIKEVVKTVEKVVEKIVYVTKTDEVEFEAETNIKLDLRLLSNDFVHVQLPHNATKSYQQQVLRRIVTRRRKRWSKQIDEHYGYIRTDFGRLSDEIKALLPANILKLTVNGKHKGRKPGSKNKPKI